MCRGANKAGCPEPVNPHSLKISSNLGVGNLVWVALLELDQMRSLPTSAILWLWNGALLGTGPMLYPSKSSHPGPTAQQEVPPLETSSQPALPTRNPSIPREHRNLSEFRKIRRNRNLFHTSITYISYSRASKRSFPVWHRSCWKRVMRVMFALRGTYLFVIWNNWIKPTAKFTGTHIDSSQTSVRITNPHTLHKGPN